MNAVSGLTDAAPVVNKLADAAVRLAPEQFRDVLDAIPAAVYTTDAEGRLTHFNRAAIEFSGRVPQIGTDRWCVSWKLYDAQGNPIRHDQCPMAVALREGREIRGVEAIAERPDGRRIAFLPFPTPLRDSKGSIVGGVNMLVDITERRRVEAALRESEEKFRRLVALMPAAVFTIDAPSGVISFYNERAAELWGRRPRLHDGQERFCGSYRLWLPDGTHMPHDQTPMVAAMREGASFRNIDVVMERPDGSRFCALVNIDPIRDATGAICGVINVFLDTTALKEAEKELLRHTNQLGAFLNTAAMGLHRVGPDGTILWANDAELSMLGYTREEYVGRNVAEFHADKPVMHDILSRLTCGERLHDYEARLRCKDGSIKTVLIDSSVLWEDGGFVHTQCFTRDITERKQAEEALRQADRRKDEFLATLSHELRNPLAPIRNAIDLLGKAGEERNVRELAHRILDRQVRQMTKLVDELMDLTRVSRGTIVPDLQLIDIADVIAAAVETSRPLFQEGRHDLSVSLPEKRVMLMGDAVRLSQVLSNLLNNAAKYTPKGGRITLTATASPGEASIAVRDNGIGIAPEVLPHVFDMFTQSGESNLSGRSGLGIGLAISRSLARLHGGDIHVSSAGPAQGSEFTLRIPIRLPEEAPVAQGTPAAQPIRPLRVLIADDNVDAAETMGILLRGRGHHVNIVYDGLAAIEAVQTHNPDVLLLDISLPKLDGFQVAERLRGENKTRDVRIVAVTGHGLEQHRERSRDAGIDAHLVKPVDVAALEDAFRRVLQ